MMRLARDEELAKRLGPLFENQQAQAVFNMRQPSEGEPVSDADLFDFIRKTGPAHGACVRDVLARLRGA